MVLCLKAWKSRTSPGIAAGALNCTHEEITHPPFQKRPVPQRAGRFFIAGSAQKPVHHVGAGWSSPVARQAHNLKVVGSNPTPATNKTPRLVRGFLLVLVSAAVLTSFNRSEAEIMGEAHKSYSRNQQIYLVSKANLENCCPCEGGDPSPEMRT